MTITFTISFKNTSNKYMLVGNASEIIATGSKLEIEKMLENADTGKYASVAMVAPGETIESNMIDNEIVISPSDDNFSGIEWK